MLYYWEFGWTWWTWWWRWLRKCRRVRWVCVWGCGKDLGGSVTTVYSLHVLGMFEATYPEQQPKNWQKVSPLPKNHATNLEPICLSSESTNISVTLSNPGQETNQAFQNGGLSNGLWTHDRNHRQWEIRVQSFRQEKRGQHKSTGKREIKHG